VDTTVATFWLLQNPQGLQSLPFTSVSIILTGEELVYIRDVLPCKKVTFFDLHEPPWRLLDLWGWRCGNRGLEASPQCISSPT
jgi:hypothetical protein